MNTPQTPTAEPLAPLTGSAFPVGSRWRTFDGEEITVTMYYETMPGCWRLCYDDNRGGGGHMGQNHIDRLTPLDTPNNQTQQRAGGGAQPEK